MWFKDRLIIYIDISLKKILKFSVAHNVGQH